jgi:hypothetical protein
MPRLKQPDRRPWPREEILRLRELAGTMEVDDIARELNRSVSAIKGAACKYGYKLKVKRLQEA